MVWPCKGATIPQKRSTLVLLFLSCHLLLKKVLQRAQRGETA